MREKDIYESYYEKLVKLKGKERADKFVKKTGYDILVMQREIALTSIYLFIKGGILSFVKFFYSLEYKIYYIVVMLFLVIALLLSLI